MPRTMKLLVCLIGFLFTLPLIGCQPTMNLGCSGEEAAKPLAFDVENLNGRLQSGLYQQKIKNLIVVVDDTMTMSECLDGQLKRDRGANMMNRIVSTIPDINLNKGVRIYGPYVDEKNNHVSLTHGMAFNPTDTLREKILTKTTEDTIYNPLAGALEGAYHELKLVDGDSAIILISDFKDPMKEMATSAQLIRDYYKGDVCVYPIVVGNDGPGRNSAEDVVGIAGCGITALDSSLESGPSLADFMEKVLFDKLEPLPPSVPMMQKKEQGLSHEKLLKERNLTVELKAEFDFDRSSIRQEYLDDLQKIAEFMKKYPETVTTIEGHTCSIGTEKYNIALSAKRANSVKKQLTDLGIDPKRLNTAAYGETRPIADNSTPEGRQKNRRAVAVITTTIQEYVNQQK